MDLTLDLRRFEVDLDRIDKRQMPQAVVWALNDTAKEVHEHAQARMEVVFDRPTRFTKNALMVWRATKSQPFASVIERPSVGKRHYLKVQEAGGPRGQTGVEKLLATHLAYDGILRSVIPATGGGFEAAQLDGHGNWSNGERNRVLSALKAQRDPLSNVTPRSKGRNRKRASYFVPRHGLAPGVYRRDAPDDIPVRVLKFSDKVPTYGARLGFLDGAAEVFQARIGPNLTRAINRALATTR